MRHASLAERHPHRRPAIGSSRDQQPVSSISVIIPTLDEELHVGRVVASAISLGSVYVLDS